MPDEACRRQESTGAPAAETYPLDRGGYHRLLMSPCQPLRRLVASAVLALVLLAPQAHGQSTLRLPWPVFGKIPSATYDEKGHRVGDARLDIMKLPGGNTYIMASTGIAGAESMTLSAELTPDDGGLTLRPLWQMSHSYDKKGNSLGVMFIDHDKGEAFCSHEDGNPAPPDKLLIPQPDRVAHVVLNLLFLPLARGETDEIKFQFLLCALGPRFVDAKATVANHLPGRDGGDPLVEVHYELDLNPVLAALARPFLPQFAFWFDPLARDPWVAHRMPLASKGPAVLILRAGVPPSALKAEP